MKISSGYMDYKMRKEMDKSIRRNNPFPFNSPRFKLVRLHGLQNVDENG